jgi:hypothetical protein
MRHSERNYLQSLQNDFATNLPDFAVYDDGRFRCLTLTLDDGRYLVITDMGGMDLPIAKDFNVCVYVNEQAFGDDPTDSIIASFTSDQYDIDTALFNAEASK